LLDCVLISSDEAFRHVVLGILRQPAYQARLALDLQVLADGLNRESVAKVLQVRPKVVFLDLGQSPSGVGGIRILTQDAPEVALVVGGPPLSAEGLLAVMRAGASEYLPRPFSQEETLEAFQRVRRRTKASASEQPPALGKVITAFSGKGGTGVTTVATNLAVALRLLTGKSVLLVDLAPALGTAAVAMGVHPRYTYLDVIQNFHRIDEELFRSFLEVDESGVHVLASPISPAGMDVPEGEELHGLIDLCRQHFDYVVVDGGSFLSSQLGPLLHHSDERLLVVTPELPALRNLKQAMELYGRSNGKAPPHLVLNQYKEGLSLTSRDVEDGLGHRISLVLERDDLRVLQSVNVGRPEVLGGSSRFAKKMMELGRTLAGPEHATAPPKGFLDRLLRSTKATGGSGKETN
jgi:pilus assembly protein CpaE